MDILETGVVVEMVEVSGVVRVFSINSCWNMVDSIKEQYWLIKW